MIWRTAHRADPFARSLADRHYNRQKVGSLQFAPPGRCFVLTAETEDGKAFWITSWPYAQYVKHAWAGAWVCSAFRTEGIGPASDLIRSAVAATRAYYGEPPALGMITFIDLKKVRPIITRGVRHWGYTYEKAGFEAAGFTQGGLLALRLDPKNMPEPSPPAGFNGPHKDYAATDTPLAPAVQTG